MDIGSYGSNSVAGVFANCLLGQGLVTNQLNLPPPVCLPGGSMLRPMPYVVVGDDVLPLKTYLMRQYPGKTLPIDKRVFNYRLSRARRISEKLLEFMLNGGDYFKGVSIYLLQNAK